MSSHRIILTVSLLLFAIGFAMYHPILDPEYEFINFDDAAYITHNPLVTGGFTRANLTAIFTAPHLSNYHPLTMLSLMLDYQLMGGSSWMFHFTNAVLNAVNGALLFLLLRMLTGKTAESAAVALLFLAHPTHVESVAWMSERKDMLFFLFWSLAVITYVLRIRKGRRSLTVCSLVLFVCSLLSKPMAVTLPLLLLVLDYWPLGRLQTENASHFFRQVIGLMKEKAPYFLISIVFCCVTVWAQSGAIERSQNVPMLEKLGAIAVSYVTYLVKTVFPHPLALIYPYRSPGLVEAVLDFVVLAAITLAVLRLRLSRPYLAAGWFFFLITLLPVIGIIQVGVQSTADRYLYLPLIGPLTALVWLISETVCGRRATGGEVPRWGRLCGFGLIAGLFTWWTTLTQDYLVVWRNTESLFRHTLAVTGKNPYAQLPLANWYFNQGNYRRAASHYIAYLEMDTGIAKVWTNLGVAVAKLGDFESAERFTRTALQVDPKWATAWRNLSVLTRLSGQLEESQRAEAEYYRLKPGQKRELLTIEARLE